MLRLKILISLLCLKVSSTREAEDGNVDGDGSYKEAEESVSTDIVWQEYSEKLDEAKNERKNTGL